MKEPGRDPQRRQHQAHRQAEPPVVAQHQRQDAQQGQPAGEQLIGPPGEDPVQRFDVRVGAIEDAALVGLVEIVQREPLNVFEDRFAQVVHRPLANGDGALDLHHGEKPAEQQVAEIKRADEEDAAQGGLGRRDVGQIAVDSDLDEFRPQQLRKRGQHREQQVEEQRPPVWPHIARQPPKGPGAHRFLREGFFQQDVVIGRHR